MTVQPVASLALNLWTVLLLLILCGTELSSSVMAVASAANTATAAVATSCVDNPDQPGCNNEGSYYNQDATCETEGVDGECESPLLKEKKSDSAAVMENGVRSGESVGSGYQQKYHNGDVVELFNDSSQDIQIVFPSLVSGNDPSRGVYHVTKTTDGLEVRNIPERHLHHYVPYKIGSEVLCNIGDFKPARPMIVRCTVLAYEAVAVKGAKVLQNNYTVRVHQTKGNDEFETTLPVWKMQRRYRGGGAA